MPRVKKVDVDVKDVVKKVNKKASKTLKDSMLKEENKKASAKKAVNTKLEKAAKEEAEKKKTAVKRSKTMAGNKVEKEAKKKKVVVEKVNKRASKKIKETMIKEDNKKDIKKQLEEAAEKEAKKKEAARKRAATIARKKAEKEAAEKENEEKTVEEKVSPYANDPRYNKTKSTNEVGRSLGWEIKKTEEPIIDEALTVEEESEPDLEVVDYLEENEPIEYTEFDKDGNKTENIVGSEEIENDTLPDVVDEIEESKDSFINSIKNSQEILAQVKSLENEVEKEKKEIEERNDR